MAGCRSPSSAFAAGGRQRFFYQWGHMLNLYRFQAVAIVLKLTELPLLCNVLMTCVAVPVVLFSKKCYPFEP
jgi:hypothetical protein